MDEIQAQAPLASPLQVADLKMILPMVKESRRTAVCAAFLGIPVARVYERAGFTTRTWSYLQKQPRLSVGAYGAVALALGVDIRDLIDEALGIPRHADQQPRKVQQPVRVQAVKGRASRIPPPVRRLRLAAG